MAAFYSMLTTKLIKILQDELDKYNASGAAEMMGEHETHVDVFLKEPNGYFRYAGVSGDIQINYTGDGVYYCISGFGAA